jgi:hypothetical protein
VNYRNCCRPSLKSLVAVGVCTLLLSLPYSSLGQGKSIYSTQFEQPDFVAGTLVGQDGWEGVDLGFDFLSPRAAVISTAKLQKGRQSVRVWGGDLVHQDIINEGTAGYYDAIGSYRKPINFDTLGIVPVRLSANVRVDGPVTPGINFFSAALSARARVVDPDGNVSTIGVGQIDLSSDGDAYAHDGNEDVPNILAGTPFTLGEWHALAIVVDFDAQTFTLSIDDEPLGTYPFPAPAAGLVTTDVLARGALLTFVAPDTETMTKESHSASYDHFSVEVVGGGRARK